MIFARGLAEIANRSAPARFGAFSLLPRVWLRISDELPRPVEVAASVAERLARVVLRQARELGEEDIARARRFRLGHGRSGLLLRRQKRLARWASHAGPAMMYTSSVLRLLMEGRARRVLGCPSRRGDSIRQHAIAQASWQWSHRPPRTRVSNEVREVPWGWRYGAGWEACGKYPSWVLTPPGLRV